MTITVLDINANRGFKMWHISQIYTGPDGTGNVVPNVNDGIIDWSSGWSRVTDVDTTTNLSTWQSWRPSNEADGVIEEDVLLGAGPGYQSESFRAMINTDVVPHTLALEGRLHVYSRYSDHVKVFRGTNIGSSGIVISAQLDQSGNVVSENLPLEVVKEAGVDTLAIKGVSVGYSMETLADGEVVTAVVYSANGTVLSTAKLLALRTNFIRTTDAARKYIESIELLSPFLAPEDSSLLKYPLNMLIQSGALKGRVNYSDGESLELPIDGTKFQLQGMENYAASQVGLRFDLMLKYVFSDNEYGIDVNGVTTERFKTADYSIMTTEVVGGYSVKLFAVPQWQSVGLGYKLNWYLYNLNRDEIYDVTPYVELVAPNNVYNPFPTGNTQTITARIELSTIGAGYSYYAHTQTITLALLTAGSSNAANWWVQYSPGGDQVGGSQSADFTSTGLGQWSIDIAIGKATTEEWLNAMYFAAEPLMHPSSEIVAPTPTHFRLRIGDTFVRTIAVQDWDQAVEAVTLTSPNPKQGEAVRFEFIRDTGSDILELGIGFMPIHIVST